MAVNISTWRSFKLSDPQQQQIFVDQLVQSLTDQTAANANSSNQLTNSIQPTVWSVRLRSYNAAGNASFEIDQRNAGTQGSVSAASASRWIDRWQGYSNLATGVLSFGQAAPPATVLVPGTNFRISQSCAQMAVTTPQATLAAGEIIMIQQQVEGPYLRELVSDVHSISVLAYCTQPLSFTVSITSPTGSLYSLTKLCTIPSNQWKLFSLPNLPVWTPSATWPLTSGNVGYVLRIGLGAGSTFTSPANDTWQAGNFVCGPGTTNLASLAAGTNFYAGFIQHEPGSQCTTLMDKPFSQNLDECLRYFQKTYLYGTAPGTAALPGSLSLNITAGAQLVGPIRYFKPMAAVPTIGVWSPTTGASQYVRDVVAAVDRQVSGLFQSAGDSGFSGWNLSSTNAGATYYSFHYTADSGW